MSPVERSIDFFRIVNFRRKFFDFKCRGYSNAAAYRHIEAARLLKAVPSVSEKLTAGSVNLSTLSKAQSIIKQQEKTSGQKVSSLEKADIIKSIENKSAVEVEQTLTERFPETASQVYQERRRVIDQNQIRLQMNLSNETAEQIQRAKEVLSHKFPNASDADIIAYAIEFMLQKIDPLKAPVKSTSAAEVKSKPQIRLSIIRKANSKCTFKDPVTGRVCGSSHQIEIDHIRPKALGGSDTPDNLRVLCRQHNLLMAEKSFGKQIMEQYRQPD